MPLEINQFNIQDPFYYHREYKNDTLKSKQGQKEKTWVDDAQRFGLVALPFISLYKPLSLPLSLAMGSLRVLSCASQLLASMQKGDGKEIAYQSVQTAIAVIALAGTIFAHPLGMLITTTHDILIELYQLLNNLKEGKYEAAVLNIANIVNNALYFALFVHGGLEVAAASFVVQIVIGAYHARDEFKKGHKLEAAGHILMAVVRGNQLKVKVEEIRITAKFKAMVQEKVAVSLTTLAVVNRSSKEEIGLTKAAEVIQDEIPANVLKIYQAYKGADLKSIIPNATNETIALLLKYHLCRPDAFGECCKLLLEKPSVPLELIQICLPDRHFLVENPAYIDALHKKALISSSTRPEVLSFLSNRDFVKDSKVRDEYFLGWFQHNMKKAGAFAGEYLEDFVVRKSFSDAEIDLLISKMPLEVQRVCPRAGYGSCYFRLWDLKSISEVHFNKISIKPSQIITNPNWQERFIIAFKYKVYKPIYYTDCSVQTGKGDSFGTFRNYIAGYFSLKGERGDFLLKEFMKYTFPSEEYRRVHASKLDEFLDAVGFRMYEDFKIHHDIAKKNEMMLFLRNQAVDLKRMAEFTKRPVVKKFLQENI